MTQAEGGNEVGPGPGSGLVDFSLRRRVTVIMLTVAGVLFGLVSFSRLGVDLLPKLNYPSLTIETQFPGAAPAEVESLVTRPIEEAVGVVSGVQRMTSVSRGGVSRVTLEFGWGRSMDFASIDVRQKLDLVRRAEGAEASVLLRLDPANDPVMRLYLTGSDDLVRLRELAEYEVEKMLESTEGVAAIDVNGGYEREIEIRVDDRKLAALALNVADVRDALAAANVDQAGGSLYENEARYLVRSRNALRSLEEIRTIPVVERGSAFITLGDVAGVRWGHKRRETVIRHGGREAVELAIYREGDANIVDVARAVHARVAHVSERLPHGHHLVVASDQAQFIDASIQEVIMGALVGGGFAVLVLLLFLGDLRSTLLVAVCIPVSIAVTFFCMQQSDTSLNLMSLGGLALGVGMLVDSSIVVLEAIFRRREAGASQRDAARLGAAEVARAVTASTLTTVVVFVPVVFLEGIAAQLFRDMAVTVSFSLLASLLVSLTLLPMLAALLGVGEVEADAPEAKAEAKRGFALVFSLLRTPIFWLVRVAIWPLLLLARLCGRFLYYVELVYVGLLKQCLRNRILVVCAVIAASWPAVEAARGLGLDLIPNFGQGEFAVVVELEEGTPVEVTDRELERLRGQLDAHPQLKEQLEDVASLSGLGASKLASGGARGEQIGRLQFKLKPTASGDTERQVVEVLRDSAGVGKFVDFRLEHSTYFSLRRPIELEIYGENLDELIATADLVRQKLAAIPATRDVESSVRLAGRELELRFDGERLRRLGLSPADVAGVLRDKLQGNVATRFQRGDRDIDIRMAATGRELADIEQLQTMIIAQREGVPILLSAVADIRELRGPTEIRRIGQQRAAIVSANLEGSDVGSVTKALKRSLTGLNLPPSVTVELGGQDEEMTRSMGSLALGVALACFLVYLVMASQFESFAQPFVVITSFPFAGVGVVAALKWTGHSLSVVAMIGVVMLAGIVVNNAIVLVDAINQRRAAGLGSSAAILEAGRSRLRPILMTTATTMLGLLPMAVGTGPGAELRASMAITVVGGLLVGTVSTLLLVPVVYGIVDLERLAGARRKS